MEKNKKTVKTKEKTPIEKKEKEPKVNSLKKEEGGEKKEEGANKKEIYWIIGVMAFALIAIALIPMISKQANTFKYEGLTFTKERFGEIPVFHYYYYTGDAGKEHRYNIYMRTDPRENNVSVDGEIGYPRIGDVVFVSLNSTAFQKCENVLREMHTIADFLNGNGYVVKAGNPDENFAKQNNITYVTCKTRPSNMVILITPGDETKILSNDDCQFITVNNCELLPAIEKFIVKSLIDGKKRSLNSTLS
ncbi:MAG: hypothetical protein AABX85_02115 [Nanoarchaeota archaeon]